jgi:hypothetical protein
MTFVRTVLYHSPDPRSVQKFLPPPGLNNRPKRERLFHTRERKKATDNQVRERSFESCVTSALME